MKGENGQKKKKKRILRISNYPIIKKEGKRELDGHILYRKHWLLGMKAGAIRSGVMVWYTVVGRYQNDKRPINRRNSS